MELSAALNLVGLVFQGVGIALAGVGLRRTWREFAPRGERFLGPVLEQASAVRKRLATAGRRLLGRSGDAVALAGRAEGRATAFGALARGSWFALSAELEPSQAIEALDKRTRVLLDTVSDLKDELRDRATAGEGTISKLSERLDAGRS